MLNCLFQLKVDISALLDPKEGLRYLVDLEPKVGLYFLPYHDDKPAYLLCHQRYNDFNIHPWQKNCESCKYIYASLELKVLTHIIIFCLGLNARVPEGRSSSPEPCPVQER